MSVLRYLYLRRHPQNKKQRAETNRRSFIKIGIGFGIIVLLICNTELENILLYKQGQTTKAFVYKEGYRSAGIYEFNVAGRRYIGQHPYAKVGNYVEIVYLPKNPKINRSTDTLGDDLGIWLYRKITE